MGIFDVFGGRNSLRASGILNGSADCHSHVLAGVDDGVRTIDESLAVLEYLESLGVSEVWCTPHVMEDMENSTDVLRSGFRELTDVYKGPVKLHLAAEYMLDTVFEQRLREQDLLVSGEDRVLVETSSGTPPVDMMDKLYELQRAGYTPLLAHPERYRYLKEKDYENLRHLGILFQLNLPSLLGFYGETVMKKACWLLEKGHYTCAGSDCHRLGMIVGMYERKGLSRKCLSSLQNIVKA